MPYTSMIGMLRLMKNSRVCLEIGAAPLAHMRHLSRPRAWRTLVNTKLLAIPNIAGFVSLQQKFCSCNCRALCVGQVNTTIDLPHLNWTFTISIQRWFSHSQPKELFPTNHQTNRSSPLGTNSSLFWEHQFYNASSWRQCEQKANTLQSFSTERVYYSAQYDQWYNDYSTRSSV